MKLAERYFLKYPVSHYKTKKTNFHKMPSPGNVNIDININVIVEF
jgi:hypothetical protein